MSDVLVDAFKGAENAKALGGFTPPFGNGEHTVLLKRFQVKESAKGKGKIVEADFLILESTTEAAGTTKGWPWFIGAPGWQGSYAESRLKEFLEGVAVSIGDTSPISHIGASLAGPAQAGRGLMMKVSVFDGKPKKAPATGYYQEIKWHPVAQGLEDIQKARALLDADGSAAAPAPMPVQAAPAPVAQAQPVQQAAASNMSALLGALKR
jgi:hypothetical protein